ncbi:M66 family metalloprotease, partial [Veronia pacifica]
GRDGVGNNADNDDDGDGVADEDDQFPLDKTKAGRHTIKHESYIAFNENSFNDLDGELSAYVLFAQHSIIPAGNHIQGDVQPHLVGNRKTLVMVKPDKVAGSGDSLTMQVLDREGQARLSIPMDSPRWLPLIAGQLEVSADFAWSGSMSDFDLPSSFDATVPGQAALSELDEAKFLEIFETADTVKVSTYNGGWRRSFHLPSSKELDGKKIVFQSSAGYDSTIFYGQSSALLRTNTTKVFVNYAGVWLSSADVELTKVKYGENFWSASIPAELIKPGMSLRFSHADSDLASTTGTLNDIKVGAPTEVLIHTIDVGMLTKNRGEFRFQDDEEHTRQYFHTIPTSRLVVSIYEPQHFKEIMMADGRLLKDKAPDSGGWHTGSMREVIGKTLISLGINNANYGINVSDVTRQRHPYTVAQMTAHNTIGVYKNGPVVHGGSGGSGMVTLDYSIGNEWSHEIGHNYDLWHYPGGFNGSVHRPADQVNSTWGWDSDNNIFMANFHKSIGGQACYQGLCQDPFLRFRFGDDPMGGGSPHVPSFNAFTLHTPFSAQFLQDFLEEKAVFSEASSTGFMKWDSDSQTMREWEHRVPVKTYAVIPPAAADEASVARKIARYDGVSVHFWDGKWTRHIHIPAASAENKEKVVLVQHSAGYTSILHINGGTVELNKGFSKIYQSDGKTWAELTDEPDTTKPRKPIRFGVPVTTLVGFFDPDKQLTSYIYPALHGSYGMVYPEDKLSTRLPDDCHLEVTTASGLKTFELARYRLVETQMNQFQVNIETSSQPSRAEIICGGERVATRLLKMPTEEAKEKLNTYVMPKPQ